MVSGYSPRYDLQGDSGHPKSYVLTFREGGEGGLSVPGIIDAPFEWKIIGANKMQIIIAPGTDIQGKPGPMNVIDADNMQWIVDGETWQLQHVS